MGEAVSVFVTKANGSKQLFDKNKVVQTCLRLGASQQVAFEVATKVENRVYNGISTSKILQMIFRFLTKHRPATRNFVDLRRGLSLMRSKPDFEIFVRLLLAYNGFEVAPNQLLKGKCVAHEVDAIAKKGGITYFVEAKHHVNYHTPTGLDESRIARAVLEDVSEGYNLGINELKVDRAMIVTNTRFSEQAIHYGSCRGILQIGWNMPEQLDLRSMIEAKQLYPLTCIRGLPREVQEKLSDAGIVLIRQVSEEDPKRLARQLGLSQVMLDAVVEKSPLIMRSF